MEVKGKKVLFLGDSITEGCGTSNPAEKGYVTVFGKISGAEVINYGVSGTRIARQQKAGYNTQFDDDYNLRADRMQKDADLVVVFGGTNDFGHGAAPFGQFFDRTEFTFLGALHVLFTKLITKYPYSKIMVITPLHRTSEDDTVNEIGLPCRPLKDYVNAIKEVAEYYSLPVLDLWSESGMQPKIDAIKDIYMCDGLHPSDAGAEVIAHKLYEFTKKL